MLKTAKIVGLNSDQEAALVLICPAQNGPTLFIIVAARADDAFSRTKGALVEAEDTFFTSEKAVSERVEEVVRQVKNSLADTEDLQLILAVAEEKNLSPDEQGDRVFYFLCQGDSLSASLIRNGHSSSLMTVSSGEMISGFLKPGDRVIMTTKSLEEVLGKDFDKLAFLPIETLEDEVVNLLPQSKIAPLATIVIEEENNLQEYTPNTENLSVLPVEQGKLGVNLRKQLIKGSALLLNFITGIFSNRRVMVILFALVVLGGILGGIQIYRGRQEASFKANVDQLLEKGVFEYQKALSLKDSDGLGAQNSIKEARLILEQVLKLESKNEKALQLKKEIEENSPNIFRVFPVEDFPLWLDLDLAKKGFAAQTFSTSLGKLLVLDSNLKVLLKIDLQSKAHDILAGEEKLGEAKFISLNGDVSWVYSEDKGIVRIEGGQTKTVIKKDSEWGEIVDIYGFAGNVYVLDKSKGQIWKYLPIESGYSDKRAYFKEGTKVDLSGALKMQIDGSIWILKNGGEILKFTQGSSDQFSLSGLDQTVKESKSFFVSDKIENLYLLDSGNSRLLILDKKGNYLSQYQGEKFKDFTDLLVDEKGKKVYFLQGSKIYWMELK